MSEENYMFRLSSFCDRLLEWIDAKPYGMQIIISEILIDASFISAVIPESSRQRVKHWILNETASDLSVSRPRSRLKWGVPVPNDDSHTVRSATNSNIETETFSLARYTCGWMPLSTTSLCHTPTLPALTTHPPHTLTDIPPS